ncbi:MAG: glutamate--tRNA ligase family protein, partial [Candidatus Nanoarchaeia archaeon]
YVCTCSQEAFKNHISSKTNCPCRSLKVKENLLRWKNMLNKNGFKPGKAVLRFKSNMKDSNPAMRDFPLARVNEVLHPRTKNKYRVWPLMNLAVFSDDIEQGMTHIIRAKDHRDNAKRQGMIYAALKIGKNKIPWIGFLGKFHFKDFELSTRKILEGIKLKKYSGWDDPKLPTVASLKKQGYKPQAFWKFAERIGLSENDKLIDRKEFFTLLDNFNKIK